MKIPGYVWAAALIALTPATHVWADETDPGEISRLLTTGDILPLGTILEIVRPITGDQILEVEVEHEDFGLTYEIYFLDAQGHRREIYVDARNGEILVQKLDD